MRDAILVCVERGRARRDIGSWDHMKIILVCHECYKEISYLYVGGNKDNVRSLASSNE